MITYSFFANEVKTKSSRPSIVIYEESSSRKRNAITSRKMNALGCPFPQCVVRKRKKKKERTLRRMNNLQEKEMSIRRVRIPDHSISLSDIHIAVCMSRHSVDRSLITLPTRTRPHLSNVSRERAPSASLSKMMTKSIGCFRPDHGILCRKQKASHLVTVPQLTVLQPRIAGVVYESPRHANRSGISCW